MTDRIPDPASERHLAALRREAERAGIVAGAGIRPAGAPFPQATPETGYYGLPLLKPPPWTWEVPVYFIVGGTAGASALIAAVADKDATGHQLARHARWIAACGAAVSPLLLISDLGRPERFLNMLRVFKLQSPMSVGAWTLVVFSNAAAAAAFADLIDQSLARRARLKAGTTDLRTVPVRLVRDAAQALAAATGMMMATYTGVLIGVTAIPAWSRHATLLPLHFGASAMASAVSLLELLGHRGDRALNAIGIGAAGVETCAALRVETDADRASEPLHYGLPGGMLRAAGLLSGPIPLLLRVFAARSSRARQAAAISTLIGSALTRIGWLRAGRRSAADPRVPLELPDGPDRS